MIDIHPTAAVAKGAEIADRVTVGPFAVIEKDVVIGEGTVIGPHVLVADGARIGHDCRIHCGAAVATLPQDLKFGGEKTVLEIGHHTTVREYATLNRGTLAHGKSRIGSHCLLMAYTHVAHDCEVGDHVIMANGVQLGGHVTIEEWAIIGGMTPVHQFCKIGRHCMIGGAFRVTQDVPPYITAADEPLRFAGLNSIGLRRRGFSSEVIMNLKRTYRLLYRSKYNVSQALEHIKAEIEPTAEVNNVISFIEKSERGIIH